MFVIDESGSMRRNNLYIKVRDDIKDYISKQDRSDIKWGDRLIIVGFGDDVKYHFDEEIKGIRDIERAKGELDRIEFRDKWTHMSKAFDILAKRIDEIHKTYPGPKDIFIYTDGKNEPPPQLGESPLAFKDILNRYWQYKTLEEKDIYICLITFGVEPPKEIIDTLPESSRVKYQKETTKPSPIITPKPLEEQPKKEKEIAPPRPKESVRHVRIPWFVWLLLVAVLAIILSVIPRLLRKEKFSEDSILLQTDENGNEYKQFSLIDYGNYITPKKLGIDELTSQEFVLFVKNGVVYLKAGAGEEIEILGEGNKKLEKDKEIIIYPDTSFRCSGLYFKFVREQNV